MCFFFFFKQKTAYEMRISDWSSDVCSSDLPDFNYLSPALLEEEVGDSDLLGNPFLAPEMSWGLDLGSERPIGRTGVAGLNFFYRDITNLIELVNTGEEGSAGPGTFVYQPLTELERASTGERACKYVYI